MLLNVTLPWYSLWSGLLDADGIDVATMVSQPHCLPCVLLTRFVSVPLERLWTNNTI